MVAGSILTQDYRADSSVFHICIIVLTLYAQSYNKYLNLSKLLKQAVCRKNKNFV